MKNALLASWLWVVVAAGMCCGLTSQEAAFAGAVADYKQPPFDLAWAADSNATCCSLGVPASWPQEESPSHSLYGKIAEVFPSAHSQTGELEVNSSGQVLVFAGGNSTTPPGLFNSQDCRTSVVRTSENQSLTASEVGSGLVLSSEVADNLTVVSVSLGDSGPESIGGVSGLLNFSGLNPGEANLSVVYWANSSYSSAHYRPRWHFECWEGLCWRYQTCDYSSTQALSATDSVNDSIEVSVQGKGESNESFFIDGKPSWLRLEFNSPGACYWKVASNEGYFEYQGCDYSLRQGLPPYNLSQVVLYPEEREYSDGLRPLRGIFNATWANELFQANSNLTGLSLQESTPFYSQEFGLQAQTPEASLLSVEPIAFQNGSGLVQINLTGSDGKPVEGGRVEVYWQGNSRFLATDPDGSAWEYSENASSSTAQAWFDSNGVYSSAYGQATFPPASPDSQTSDFAVALIEVVCLSIAGVALLAGVKPFEFAPWLPGLAVGGVVLWVLWRMVAA